MKNVLLGAVITAAVLLGINASVNQTQVEEYAIVNVIEKSTRLIIRTTVNGEETKVDNLKLDYLDDEDLVEFKPVVQELARLNAAGFQLVNGSTTSMVYGSSKFNSNRPYHTFVLKRMK